MPATPSRARRAGVTPGAGGDGRAFEGVRLHVVTGKGGTGKTTVAASLALALSAHGRRVLLIEVEDRQGFARLFDVGPLGYEARSVAIGPSGGEVLALAVEPRAALLEYLARFYKMGRAGRVLEKTGAVEFATTIAPGLRDVLLTGKVYDATRSRTDGRFTYDAVVLDAPPTGRITRFLNVNTEVEGLAKVGPVHNQASSVMRLIRSSAVVHLVTLLEEMAVQETLDGIAELSEAGLPVGGVVINQVRAPVLAPRDLSAAAKGRMGGPGVAEALLAASVARDRRRASTMALGLIAEAGEPASRVGLQQRERASLDAAGRPVFDLPHLASGIDLGGLYELSESLRQQGFG